MDPDQTDPPGAVWSGPHYLPVCKKRFEKLARIFSRQHQQTITKTYLYNFDPLKPHFYIVKLEFTGVYIIFLISAQIHRFGYSLEPPRTSTHNLCFEQKCEKYQNFLSENFHFLMVKFSLYLNRYVFIMRHFQMQVFLAF